MIPFSISIALAAVSVSFSNALVGLTLLIRSHNNRPFCISLELQYTVPSSIHSAIMMDPGTPDSPEPLSLTIPSLGTFRSTRAGFMISMVMFFELHMTSFRISIVKLWVYSSHPNDVCADPHLKWTGKT